MELGGDLEDVRNAFRCRGLECLCAGSDIVDYVTGLDVYAVVCSVLSRLIVCVEFAVPWLAAGI